MPTILAHITDWLRQYSNLIITGLIAFIGSTITNVVLAPLVSHRIRERAEKRNEHLAELKSDVFRPMIDHLRDHVVPVLELRLGNVGMRRQVVRRPSAGLMENDTTFVDELCFREAVEPPIDVSMCPEEDTQVALASLEGPLYQDARLHHFPECLSAWDNLLAAFHKHNGDCIAYVEKLRQEIAQSCSLPEYDGSLRQPEYVNAIGLALIVFFRQLRLFISQFSPGRQRGAVGLSERLHASPGSASGD